MPIIVQSHMLQAINHINLMYGPEPRLAIDVEYGVTMPTLTDNVRYNYVKKLQARLK